MIIGINGYMGSGKDTVGKIIQYFGGFVNPLYIPSTFEEYYKTCTIDGAIPFGPNIIYPPKWQIKKFGGKLKQIASILTGIPTEKFEDQEFKKTNLTHDWQYLVSKPGKRQDGLFGTGEKEIVQMTVREFLQKLGTEAIRNGLHTNAWVNALFADYVPYSARGSSYECEESNWIITDVRFPNEAKAIKERGGIIIRVNRIKEGSELASIHLSETSLDSWEFDEVIYNNGTIDELVKKVKVILEKRKII